MFSQGQKIFAICFIIIFLAVILWSYIKDTKLHRIHYKRVYIVALAIIIVIIVFAKIVFSMH